MQLPEVKIKLEYWFSNLGRDPNHGIVKTQVAELHPQSFRFSRSDGAQDFAVLRSYRIMLMLLVGRPQWETLS